MNHFFFLFMHVPTGVDWASPNTALKGLSALSLSLGTESSKSGNMVSLALQKKLRSKDERKAKKQN